MEKKSLQPEFQPKPEPEARQRRAPEQFEPAETAPVQEDDKAAKKTEFLERQRQLRDEQKQEPDQQRDLDRDESNCVAAQISKTTSSPRAST